MTRPIRRADFTEQHIRDGLLRNTRAGSTVTVLARITAREPVRITVQAVMKAHAIFLLAVFGLLTTLAPVAAMERARITTAVVPDSNAGKFSGNLDEVVKLFQSGVDEGVILAFVQNSPVANQPSADEIIRLRELGISSDVITAVLRRGGELRSRIPTAAGAQPRSTAPASTAALASHSNWARRYRLAMPASAQTLRDSSQK